MPSVLLGLGDLGHGVARVGGDVAVIVAGVGGHHRHGLLRDPRLVLGPDEPGLDRRAAVAVDRDERAGDGDVGGVERDRALAGRLERGHAPVLLADEFAGLGRRSLDVVGFLAQGREGHFVLVGQRQGVAAQLAQAEGVAADEVGRDLGPLPALHADGLGLLAQLLGDHHVDEPRILQPAAVVALEQVAEGDAPGLLVGGEADEPRPLVRRAHGALGRHAPDGAGLLVVGLAQPRDHLRPALVVAGNGGRRQLVERHAVLGVDVEQLRRDRRQPQPLLDHAHRHEERSRDLLPALALLAQAEEGAELVERVQRRALDVLAEALLLGQTALAQDAGHRRGPGHALSLDQELERPEAATAGRVLVDAGRGSIGVGGGTDAGTLEQAAPGDVLGQILGRDAGPHVPDVGPRQDQLAERDVTRGRERDLLNGSHVGMLRVCRPGASLSTLKSARNSPPTSTSRGRSR